ncbi:hypothetical protein [Nucisporomicrobium flavum]|uniref:hypothetical protein n=1 Tax=Nucisporomicrobium flavum TaxID=2785915 RepID=UPI0018F73E3C|nr:hypothetical protein [Nucisporomicrobium flavum]
MGADWDAYNLPAIWSMLKGENACTGADRVLSWEGLAHDVRVQHRRLLDAKESLAAVWPPDKNASARVFLDRMDLLAASMNDTLTRAEDTRAGLRGILEALGAAQAEVQPWVEVRQNASGDIIPRFVDHAEDEYDEKARKAMRRAEAAIADHSTQIQPPQLYKATPSRGEPLQEFPDDEPNDGAGGPGAGTSAGLGNSSGARPVPVEVPHHPPVPDRFPDHGPTDAAPQPGIVPTGGGLPGSSGGPDLAGVLPTPSTVPVTGGSGTIPSGAGTLPGGVGASGGLFGGAGPFGVPPGAFPGGGGGTALPLGRGAAQPGRQAVPVRSAMPSGTVIGGPSTGGRPGATGRTASSGRGRAGQQIGQQTAANRARRGATAEESHDGVADQTWEVLDGVPPVIAPDTRPARHDPGPGVIGLSR